MYDSGDNRLLLKAALLVHMYVTLKNLKKFATLEQLVLTFIIIYYDMENIRIHTHPHLWWSMEGFLRDVFFEDIHF